MAITWNGTALGSAALEDAEITEGTIPTVTPLTGAARHLQATTINVAKSGVENASKSVTFDAIVSAIDTLLNGIVTNDFIASNTVDAYGTLTKITEVTQKYTSVVASYDCTVNIYTKVS